MISADITMGYFNPIPLFESVPEPSRHPKGGGYATIATGGASSAQGPVIRRLGDGRITVSIGADQELTGWPVDAERGRDATGRGGFWAKLRDALVADRTGAGPVMRS